MLWARLGWVKWCWEWSLYNKCQLQPGVQEWQYIGGCWTGGWRESTRVSPLHIYSFKVETKQKIFSELEMLMETYVCSNESTVIVRNSCQLSSSLFLRHVFTLTVTRLQISNSDCLLEGETCVLEAEAPCSCWCRFLLWCSFSSGEQLSCSGINIIYMFVTLWGAYIRWRGWTRPWALNFFQQSKEALYNDC